MTCSWCEFYAQLRQGSVMNHMTNMLATVVHGTTAAVTAPAVPMGTTPAVTSPHHCTLFAVDEVSLKLQS